MSDQVGSNSTPDGKSDSAATQAVTPAGFDLKLTHVVHQWAHTSPLIACRFEPGGKYVFSAAQDNTLQRWELATGKATPFVAHDSWVRAIGFSPDGTTMYSGGYDGQLIIWNTCDETPAPRAKVSAHDGWIRSLAVSPDGKLVATGGNDNRVKLWDAVDGKLHASWEGHGSHVYSIMFDPSGNLLSGDLGGSVIRWDMSTGQKAASFDAADLHSYNDGQGAHYGGVRGMSISPDRKFLACGGLHKASNPFGAVQEPLVMVFEYDSQKKTQIHIGDGITQGIVWRVVYHPSGTLIGASGGGSGGHLLFWTSGQEKETHKLQLPNTALDCDLHPDMLRVATAHHDKHLRISQMTKPA